MESPGESHPESKDMDAKGTEAINRRLMLGYGVDRRRKRRGNDEVPTTCTLQC